MLQSKTKTNHQLEERAIENSFQHANMKCCGGGGGVGDSNNSQAHGVDSGGGSQVILSNTAKNNDPKAAPLYDASQPQASKEKIDAVYKLLMLGDSGVGKTCLLLRFCDDVYHGTFTATIGIDLKSKLLDMDGKRVKLQIWDTAGQERFRTITHAYYRGAMGIVLCYDTTSKESFENIRNWIKTIEQNGADRVSKILVANKADLTEEKAVSTQEGQELADEYGIRFFETSAKNSVGVEEVFAELVREVKRRLDR